MNTVMHLMKLYALNLDVEPIHAVGGGVLSSNADDVDDNVAELVADIIVKDDFDVVVNSVPFVITSIHTPGIRSLA